MADNDCTKICVCDEVIRAKITEPVLKVHMTEVISMNETGGSNACSGGVFIVDVVPVNSSDVVSIDWLTDPSGKQIVNGFSTDTTDVRIFVEWDGAGPSWSGDCFINTLLIANPTEIASSRRFAGSAVLDITGLIEIEAEHECGAKHTISVDLQGNGPTITSVNFVNGYPGSQTEVKENDTFDVEVHFDPSGSEASHVEIADYGCSKFNTIDLSTTELVWGTTHTATITITIDNTSLTPTLLPVRIRGRNSFGTFGPFVDSDTSGVVDGFNVLLCNDTVPTFNNNGTNFPTNQLAFKGNETGTQNVEVINSTSVSYSSPTSEFTIDSPSVYGISKTITCTNPGTYNDSTPNFAISASRAANDTTASFSTNVEVADTAPLITVTQPQARLRSSQAGETYTITATGDQNIANTPLIALDVPVSGTWQGAGFIGSLKSWTRMILIEDGDASGIASWSFISVPTNRAGIPATIIGDQNVGGFLPRTITIAAWPNREVNIGTRVSDASKVFCENLSKGGDGANGGTDFTYSPNVDNELDMFTICDPSGVANVTGDLWFNKDQPNAVSNTGGTAQVIIWETV